MAEARRGRRPRLLNLEAAALLALVILILYSLSTTVADLDLWGYLAFGRLFWTQERFPYHDVFSYVPTLSPWVYHEWLTGVIFYPIFQTLGAPGLQMFKFALGLAALGLVYLTARRRGAAPLPAAALLASTLMVAGAGYGAVRAQVFTYAGFAATLYLLETARQSGQPRCLWWLAPIQLVWCNLHGGFLAGLGLMLLYALGEALSRRPYRPYLLGLLAAILATLVNPYGLQYWTYLAHAATMPRPEILEWGSLWQGYRHGILPAPILLNFIALVTLTVTLAWWARWRELTPALVLLVTLGLALNHTRHLVFFALSFGTYMPALLTAYFRAAPPRPGGRVRPPGRGRRLSALLMIAGTVFLTSHLIRRGPLDLKIPAGPPAADPGAVYYPVGAVDYLEQQRLAGNLLVNFDWGEYCLWRLYPQCRVAVDGRYETVYPADLTREYFDFLLARPGWRTFLERYPPDMILIDIRSRLYGLLRHEPGWRQAYADSGCVLLLRSQKR
jgi:hypothetical protein